MSEPLEPEAVDREPEEPLAITEQHLLKRWTFLLALVAVWIPAATIGLALYYWWFHSLDKTWPVFVVLIFVGVCTGAAILHGTYYCDRVSRCLVGLIPY